MRKRFKTCMICSSERYESSHKQHLDFLQEEHKNNLVIIEEIVAKRTIYVSVMGKLIPITEEEYKKHSTLNVIIK